ncbi:TonB-dependent receptor [uncultured Shewanella sp.]|uniref:TonB-dependent receptor n=1 Tax=uncultured Shewanella sp. TaxID=173975 RepID=UPI002634229B|nr:TonB-dependent receptor [uncultured Shewanella sp.]
MLLTPRFKMKALALSMSLVCVTVLPTYASQAQAINIKPTSVGSVLFNLAKTNNIDIYVTKESLEQLPLPDNFMLNMDSVAHSLTALLVNTDLEAHWLNETQVVIKHKDDKRAADQWVTFDNNVLNLTQDPADIERISVYARHNRMVLDSSTATKSNMSLMETPAAIVVVDSELLSEQGISTLQDSIRNVSGLTQAGNNYGIGDNLVIRGLGVNYTLDGMYGGASLGNSYNPTRSLTNIESLEVLKGPATGLYGMGAAGGIINMIEKKPQYVPNYQIQASIGQWDSHSLMFDATAPITEQTAYRLVGSYGSSDGYRELSSERSEIYASLSHQLNDNNKFIFSAAYIDDEVQVDSIGHPVRIMNYDGIDASPGEIGWQDLPNDSDGDGDKKTGIKLTQEQRQQLADSLVSTDGLKPFDLGEQGLISPLSRPNEGQEMRLKLQHEMDIDTNVFLHQQLAYREYSSDFVRQTGAYNYVYWNRKGEINADPRAPLVIDGVLYPYAARRQEYRRTQADEKTWQYFADLTVTWSLPMIEGEHLFSANVENRDMALKSWSAYDADGAGDDANPIPYILDIRNPNWGTGSFEDYDPVLKSHYDKSVSAWGVSFQEVLYFTEKLTGRFGVAYSGTKQSYQHKGTDSRPEKSQEADTDDAGATYNLGLNYRINEQLATFVNYAKGRMTYSVLGEIENTDDVDPIPDSESLSFDVGVRFTAFDEDLLGSLVWFKTQRTNLRYSNPEYNDNVNDVEFNISVPQYYYDNNDTTKGVEFDLNLALNDVWSMNLNATYQDAYSIRSEKEPDQIKVNTKGVPQKFASLWSSYEYQFSVLPAPVTLSLGVTYEDVRSINSSDFGLPDSVVDAYVLWDASIGYQIEEWDIQLSLRNLTDTTYYSKALFIGGLPGDGRNAQLTVSYNFD